MAIPEQLQKETEQAREEAQRQIEGTTGTPDVETPVPEPEDVTPQHQATEPDWGHKYEVLKGKYDAEVPNLTGQNKDLKQQLDRTQQDLAAMQQQMEQLNQAKQDEDKGPAGLDISSYEDYGEEIVALVDKLNHVEAQNQTLREQLDGVSRDTSIAKEQAAKSLSDQFYDSLASAVPEWEKINSQPEFLAWLSEEEGLSGATRQNILDRAASEQDVNRVVNIFKAFTNGNTQPQERARELARHVQPDGVRTESAPSKGKSWKQSEIDRFYNERNKGGFRGREEEARKITQEIFRAAQEGRIIP